MDSVVLIGVAVLFFLAYVFCWSLFVVVRERLRRFRASPEDLSSREGKAV